MGSRAHGSERLRVATEVLEGIIAAGCSPD